MRKVISFLKYLVFATYIFLNIQYSDAAFIFLYLCYDLLFLPAKFAFAPRDASVFTKRSKDRIGKIYKKTIYREFTDGSFTKQKPHRKDLGILGPVFKGEVGDDLKVTFKVSTLK